MVRAKTFVKPLVYEERSCYGHNSNKATLLEMEQMFIKMHVAHPTKLKHYSGARCIENMLLSVNLYKPHGDG